MLEVSVLRQSKLDAGLLHVEEGLDELRFHGDASREEVVNLGLWEASASDQVLSGKFFQFVHWLELLKFFALVGVVALDGAPLFLLGEGFVFGETASGVVCSAVRVLVWWVRSELRFVCLDDAAELLLHEAHVLLMLGWSFVFALFLVCHLGVGSRCRLLSLSEHCHHIWRHTWHTCWCNLSRHSHWSSDWYRNRRWSWLLLSWSSSLGGLVCGQAFAHHR